MSLSLSLSPDSCQVVASVQLVDECGCKHLHMKLCKKRAQGPNFPFSSVLFGDFVTKKFFVTLHSVGLEILCDEFLGYILAEKCQFAAAIDGGVRLDFGS